MGQVSATRADGGQSAVLSLEKHTCNDLLEPCPRMSRPSQPSNYDQEVWRGSCCWKSKPVSYNVILFEQSGSGQLLQAPNHHNDLGRTDLISGEQQFSREAEPCACSPEHQEKRKRSYYLHMNSSFTLSSADVCIGENKSSGRSNCSSFIHAHRLPRYTSEGEAGQGA